MNNISFIYKYLSIEEIISFFKINNNFLKSDFQRSNNFPYRDIEKLKPNGDFRKITAPHVDLKRIQRLILKSILESHPLDPSAYGIGSTKTIKHNAIAHQLNHDKSLLNLDIEKFFPSINYQDVKMFYLQLGFSRECANLLTRLTTYNKALPQGSPTSSYLSSLIFKHIDEKINKIVNSKKLTYTRYVDDITISGNFFIKDKFISKIKSVISKSNFRLHGQEKTYFFNPHQDKTVNNIVIYKNKIDVTERYKNSIIESIKTMNLTDKKEIRKIRGRINFCKYINNDSGDILLELFSNKSD